MQLNYSSYYNYLSINDKLNDTVNQQEFLHSELHFQPYIKCVVTILFYVIPLTYFIQYPRLCEFWYSTFHNYFHSFSHILTLLANVELNIMCIRSAHPPNIFQWGKKRANPFMTIDNLPQAQSECVNLVLQNFYA